MLASNITIKNPDNLLSKKFLTTKIISTSIVFIFLVLLFFNLNYKLPALIMPGYIAYDVKRISEIFFLLLVALITATAKKHQTFWLVQ